MAANRQPWTRVTPKIHILRIELNNDVLVFACVFRGFCPIAGSFPSTPALKSEAILIKSLYDNFVVCSYVRANFNEFKSCDFLNFLVNLLIDPAIDSIGNFMIWFHPSFICIKYRYFDNGIEQCQQHKYFIVRSIPRFVRILRQYLIVNLREKVSTQK